MYFFISGAIFALVFMLALALSPVSLLETLSLKTFATLDTNKEQGVIVLTGGSSGIGKHAALYLAKQQGIDVFVTVRKQEDAAKLLEEFTGDDNSGGSDADETSRLHPILCDVTNREQIRQARETVEAFLRQPSNGNKQRVFLGVVNNAGITSELEMLEHMPEETLDRVWDVNLKGAFRVYQEFLLLLRKSKGKGRIVNIGSVAGFAGRPFRGSYTISKFALEGLTETQRLELHHEDIAVIQIDPGYIQSNLFAKNTEMSQQKYAERDDFVGWTSKQLEMLEGFKVKYESGFAMASTPQETTNAIAHALLDAKPRTRYFPGMIGMGRSLKAWIVPKMKCLLPDYLSDKIILKSVTQK